MMNRRQLIGASAVLVSSAAWSKTSNRAKHRRVCGSFLSVVPQILGHLSFDPEIEKAVNQMVPFPLNRQNSPAALDLQELALSVLVHCHDQPDALQEVRPETQLPAEEASGFRA